MAEKLICDLCKVELVNLEVQFEYLGKGFQQPVLRCPLCGQIYLSEELVNGRINQLEQALEDK